MAEGKVEVALVTGGSNGIGAAVCRRLHADGVQIMVADVDDKAGRAVAKKVGGAFVHCDVRDLEQVEAAVAATEERFGGLDLAHLNAGITTGCTLGDDFDLEAYRRAMAVNFDGVVFGVHAALPALRRRGGGRIIVTASLAGLVAVPGEPVYAANKHALVGLVRSLGPTLAAESISINALCPGFADTAIVTGPLRELLDSIGLPLLEVSQVVDAFMQILESEDVGRCWFVQVGRPSEPYNFGNVPGPRFDEDSAEVGDELFNPHPAPQ